MKKIIIYSTPPCTFCKLAKDYFDKEGFEYTDINVAEDEEAYEDMKMKSGQSGVPVIEIDNQVFLGFNPRELRPALGE